MVPYLHSDIVYEDYTQIFWERKFAFFPKTCNITGKRIWLEYGMRGLKFDRISDQFNFNKTEYWHDEVEHTFWMLKQ